MSSKKKIKIIPFAHITRKEEKKISRFHSDEKKVLKDETEKKSFFISKKK